MTKVKIIESGFKFLTDPFGDIIFTYISVVILSVLIFVILLFLRKVKSSFYIVSTVYNLIIAIPIFNMYNYAFSCCIRLDLQTIIIYVITSFPWITLYVLVFLLSAILLAMYLIFQKDKTLI